MDEIQLKTPSFHDESGRSRIQRKTNEAEPHLRAAKNVSIWDASVSVLPCEMAGIKGSSSCGRREVQSQRRERRLHHAHMRTAESAERGRGCCAAESAETQPARRGALAPEQSFSRC